MDLFLMNIHHNCFLELYIMVDLSDFVYINNQIKPFANFHISENEKKYQFSIFLSQVALDTTNIFLRNFVKT